MFRMGTTKLTSKRVRSFLEERCNVVGATKTAEDTVFMWLKGADRDGNVAQFKVELIPSQGYRVWINRTGQPFFTVGWEYFTTIPVE